MSYAIRKDGQGWRTVNGPDDVEQNETYSVTQPELMPATDSAFSVAVRADRNARLTASDWVVLRAQEAGEPVPDDWRAYRQALRDVPKQKGFPAKIKWPAAPAAS